MSTGSSVDRALFEGKTTVNAFAFYLLTLNTNYFVQLRLTNHYSNPEDSAFLLEIMSETHRGFKNLNTMILKHLPDELIEAFISQREHAIWGISQQPEFFKVALCQMVLEKFRNEYYNILAEMSKMMLLGGVFGDLGDKKWIRRFELNYLQRVKVFKKGYLYRMKGFAEWMEGIAENKVFLEDGTLLFIF